jgi:hypothetical protein
VDETMNIGETIGHGFGMVSEGFAWFRRGRETIMVLCASSAVPSGLELGQQSTCGRERIMVAAGNITRLLFLLAFSLAMRPDPLPICFSLLRQNFVSSDALLPRLFHRLSIIL